MIYESPHSTISTLISDKVTNFIGSWFFIITQSIIIIFWIYFNATGVWSVWDPYPFIFLNLALSFQAAYTAPIIMMSQNRQNQIDRNKVEQDYDTDVGAKKEIEESLAIVETLQKRILVLEKKIDNETRLEELIPDLVKKLDRIEKTLISK
jgi:uncharacterized membrane protein